MSRTPRNRDSERSAIQASANRLLAGTPLHSSSGKLTTTELIVECGLRRDVVYEHRDLIDDFKAQVRARDRVPDAAKQLADRVASLEAELRDVQAQLVRERQTNAYLRRVVTEQSIDLQHARQPGTTHTDVTPLTPRQRHFRQTT